MFINTKRFGPVEVKEDQVITFVSPLLGFGDLAKYIFVQLEEDRHPFEFLQSIEDENLTFIVMDPFSFYKEYEFQLESHWIEALNVESEEELRVMVIVTARSAEDITCNLKAPIVLNCAKNIAAQIVLEHGDYTTRQSLMEGKGEAPDADLIKK
ncbi:flagellar assembly protein FliW [Paenibacillus sp. ISL-20]|uniref:flagellar assembly protein FliW n=1 Tax=Paenibacillus sp. ISL-20 TaxID=2819163 RepID=UPI001BE67C35|nr:flagellar assembly protein FliW [Paenibacillus sp. ISL-20]